MATVRKLGIYEPKKVLGKTRRDTKYQLRWTFYFTDGTSKPRYRTSMARSSLTRTRTSCDWPRRALVRRTVVTAGDGWVNGTPSSRLSSSRSRCRCRRSGTELQCWVSGYRNILHGD